MKLPLIASFLAGLVLATTPITLAASITSSDPINPYPEFIYPAQGVLTSGYGWRWGRLHKGIDIAGAIGTPIAAAATGMVSFAGWNEGGYGNLVEIKHEDGTVTRYAHNSQVLVTPGQFVEQGDVIALMGSTGNSTGPHLHFEIRLPGQGAVNPIAYLPKQVTANNKL